jgi:hypothetical protein
MTDQSAREFVEMLAVAEPTKPPPCPLCGRGHQLETRCAGTDHQPSEDEARDPQLDSESAFVSIVGR